MTEPAIVNGDLVPTVPCTDCGGTGRKYVDGHPKFHGYCLTCAGWGRFKVSSPSVIVGPVLGGGE